jgi:hypothetical protein
MFQKGLVIIATSVLPLLTVVPTEALSQTPTSSKVVTKNLVAQISEHSGIVGIVLIGPINPVEQLGVPNSRPFPNATIRVLNAAGQLVTVFQSGPKGGFRVKLEPGTYTLQPVSGNPFPIAEEQVVTVSENEFTRVVIEYDTGIR